MPSLSRTLTLNTAIAIVVGGVIGSGIFMKPALMASQLGSTSLLLSVWVVAGIVTMFGALSNAELASMFPETGGPYVFFQKMYGDGFAFLYGWASFAVFNTAGSASIAYVFSQYANYFVTLPRFSATMEHAFYLYIPFIGTIYPLENIGLKGLTILIIVGLTVLNSLSTRQGSALQRLLTSLKAIAILLLVVGLLFSGKGNVSNIGTTLATMPTGWALVGAYMAAMSGAFWAYDGWNNVNFVAGEIEHPQRNIPLSLFWGLLFCTSVYVLTSLAYSYVLPLPQLAASSFVASDAATTAYGTIGGSIIALMVMLSVFGTTNSNVFAVARVTFTMGQENRWFSWAGKVNPKRGTPANALILNAVWTCMLILSGSFDMLTDMLVFVSWFFYGMSALGIFVLRAKLPDVPRAYKVWGYPVVPAFFVAFTTFYLLSTLYTDITNYTSGKSPLINSVFGIAITCIGLPIYYFSRTSSKQKSAS
jgi:APA family basic amino acid/polyamine antiporter